jgi:hypothetical protein
MTKEIKLTKGMVALVDDRDFEWLNQRKWNAKKINKVFYARYRIRDGKIQKDVYMHRLIVGAPSGVEVDHANGNGLDNRRFNLRLATHAQNQQNKGPNNRNTSGYKGVSWDKEKRRWTAHTTASGKSKCLGRFTRKEDAAHAYNEAVQKLHGPFAWLNKIPAQTD